MIDMRLQPPYLPQISMPYTVAIERLSDEGVECSYETINPEELNPIQGITFSDFMTHDLDDSETYIWVSNDNRIVDGHHKWNKALNLSKPVVNIIKVNLNSKDASRILNKIQDIYEYEQNLKLEELSTQQMNINDKNSILNDDIDDEIGEYSNNEKNQITMFGYRKETPKEGSVVGNFFMLEEIDGYDKYELCFDNLLDIETMGIRVLNNQNPIDILFSVWFPNTKSIELAEKIKISENQLKTKLIAEKAIKFGYDGIKYNDKLIQVLNIK